MKKTLVFGGLIAAMVLAFSCNKEQTIEEPVLHEYTFAVCNGDSAVNTADTKSVLGSDDNGMFLQWESTDELNTWASVSEGNYSYNNKSAIDASTSPVTFKIKSYQLLSAGATAYASYPYASNNNKTPIAKLSFPTAQSQNGETFVANAMPMVSKPFPISNAIEETSGISDETTAVAFYNLGGIIEFDIYSPTGTYAEENIKSVKFEAASKIAGSFEFDLRTVDPSDASTLSIADEDYAETAVTTTVSGTLAVGSATKASNAKKVYMAVAPGSYTGTVTVITSGATYVYPVSAAKTIERSAVKRLGINLEKDGVRQETIDYVTLDWESIAETDTEGLSSADLGAIAGVTVNTDATDYKSSNAPYLPKFSTSNHYIIVKTDAQIGQVKLNVKGFSAGSGNVNSTLNISSSIDGDAWTEVQSFEISSTTEFEFTTTNAFTASHRYVKIGYTKAKNNIGIGRIFISKPNTDPAIIPTSITDVPAVGVSDVELTEAYTVMNFTDDVEVASVTGCVTEAIADAGSIVYSVAPNYTTTAKDGTIVLWSAANHSITSTINVAQLKSTLTVSKTEVIIPASSTSATFTVTTAEFGYTAAVTSTESGMNLSISSGASGSASESAQTITVASTTEAPTSGDAIILGIVKVYRNGNTSDPQYKEITIKKDVSTSDVYYVKATKYTSGKAYLIVSNGYVLAHPGTSAGTIAGVSVDIADNKILKTSEIEACEFTIEDVTISSNTYQTLAFDNSGTTTYVTGASKKTSLGRNTSKPTSASAYTVWKVATTTSYGSFTITNNGTNNTSRAIRFRSGTEYNCFGNYASADGSEYYNVDLYELSE
ncbi:MAG: hypothetical protein IJ623_02785 [Bacteroidales bacterium]|nr:hypothetical protein [Bacteroidales bacterium]